MSYQNNLLIDNWTLQSVGELLKEGLYDDDANELVVSSDLSTHSYRSVSLDVLNVRCLFQILGELVFNDRLLVDDQGTCTWMDSSELLPLHSNGIVIPKPFLAIKDQWLPARNAFVEMLCVSPSMSELHKRNVARYYKSGDNEDPFFGQLIWGGSGMLGRAHALGLPYSSHPIREAWFKRVDSLFGERSAQQHLDQFIQQEQVKVYNRIDHSGYLANLSLPPVAALAIQEASDASDLIKIGLQLRETYEPLRKWLREFQEAIDSNDTEDQLKRQNLLDSVSRHIASMHQSSPTGETTVQVSMKLLKVTRKVGDPINSLQNKFGVRAAMNQLILAPAGREVVQKLAKLFGEQHSSLAFKLEQALVSRT